MKGISEVTLIPKSKLEIGLGLRAPHYSTILENLPDVSWFEAISENYMGIEGGGGGRPLQILEKIRSHYQVVLHGVSMSIGSADEVNISYLKNLKKLVEIIQPAWISDHLCWTGVEGENLHDLLPLPYTEEALRLLTQKIERSQSFLGRQLVFENVSAYISFEHSEMTEWEFITQLCKRAGCKILLDINNIYVSAINQGFDPSVFLRSIPQDFIQQIHLAGHSLQGQMLIDTHDAPVSEAVWELYHKAIQIFGKVPTLIEWDDKIPEFSVLQIEAYRARRIWEGESGFENKSSAFVS